MRSTAAYGLGFTAAYGLGFIAAYGLGFTAAYGLGSASQLEVAVARDRLRQPCPASAMYSIADEVPEEGAGAIDFEDAYEAPDDACLDLRP